MGEADGARGSARDSEAFAPGAQSPLPVARESALQDVVWGAKGQRKGRAAEKRNGEVQG